MPNRRNLQRVQRNRFALSSFALSHPLRGLQRTLRLNFNRNVTHTRTITRRRILSRVKKRVRRLTVQLTRRERQTSATHFIAQVNVSRVKTTRLAFTIGHLRTMQIRGLTQRLIIKPQLRPTLIQMVSGLNVNSLFTPRLVIMRRITIRSLSGLTRHQNRYTFFNHTFTINRARQQIHITSIRQPSIKRSVTPQNSFSLRTRIHRGHQRINSNLLRQRIFTNSRDIHH